MYFILVFLWVIFYASHTLLASLKIKRKIQGIMSKRYKWYRLVYSLISLDFIFFIFFYAGSLPKLMIFEQTSGILYLGYLTAGLGTIIIVKSLKYFSGAKFIGLIPYNDLEEEREELVTVGIYNYIRHPIYTGLIGIFIGYFLFNPNSAALIHLISLLVYLPFGIFYEEKKLIEIYGQEYLDYKKHIPALFPKIAKAAK
jgi:protein-S-isoprenylcysteine O-methyltransferase Ste14